MVENLGAILFDLDGYHDADFIYPVGYSGTRALASVLNPADEADYVFEIRYGGAASGPVFVITDDQDEEFDGASPDAAWAKVPPTPPCASAHHGPRGGRGDGAGAGGAGGVEAARRGLGRRLQADRQRHVRADGGAGAGGRRGAPRGAAVRPLRLPRRARRRRAPARGPARRAGGGAGAAGVWRGAGAGQPSERRDAPARAGEGARQGRQGRQAVRAP